MLYRSIEKQISLVCLNCSYYYSLTCYFDIHWFRYHFHDPHSLVVNVQTPVPALLPTLVSIYVLLTTSLCSRFFFDSLVVKLLYNSVSLFHNHHGSCGFVESRVTLLTTTWLANSSLFEGSKNGNTYGWTSKQFITLRQFDHFISCYLFITINAHLFLISHQPHHYSVHCLRLPQRPWFPPSLILLPRC